MILAGVLALGTLGASSVDARYDALSHQMMCTCGCVQLLGECNHVGCESSGPMTAALHSDLAEGMSDRAILMAFEQQYGPTVLAAPMFSRWNRASWYVPPAVLILGLLLAMLVLRRWKGASQRRTAVAAPAASSAEAERVRREMGGF
jgi:cytochrome c-type biogenesis protein CcmH/NrfF